MLRTLILAAARNDRIRRLVSTVPFSRGVVRRFVAGERVEDAVAVTGALARAGLAVTLDHLGEDTADVGRAEAATKAYVVLLQQLDPALALDHARAICEAARTAGTTVTLDMEDHTTTDVTLGALRELRQDFPRTGAVLQAYLRRTESDCRDLAHPGSLVRLCKGAYDEPPSVAYQERAEVDASYARCLAVLFAGGGYPMVATHDPALIGLAGRLAGRFGHSPGEYEHQLLYGVRPDEQRRLVAAGRTVRVYVPYGDEWYGYLVRRLAERPANLAFFLRALVSRS